MFNATKDYILSKRQQTTSSNNYVFANQVNTIPSLSYSNNHRLNNPFVLHSDHDWLENLPDQPLNQLSKNSFDNTTFITTTMFGYCALRVLGYPPTLIKTYMQSSLSPTEKRTFTVAMEIVSREGWSALFKGLPLSLLSTVTRQSYFFIYEHIRANEMTDKFIRRLCSEEYVFLVKDSFAAFIASAAFQVIGNPVDVIVQRMMIQIRSNIHPSAVNIATHALSSPPYTNSLSKWLTEKFPTLELTRDLIKTNGVEILYRGFLSSALLYATSSAIWWGTFGYIIGKLTPYCGTPGPYDPEQTSAFDHFFSPQVKKMYHNHSWTAQHIAAGLSSTLSVVITQPLDVCRTRLMVQSKTGDGLSASRVFRDLIKKNGPSVLLTGMFPRIVSVVPTSIMTMAVYQYCKLIAVETKLQNTHKKTF